MEIENDEMVAGGDIVKSEDNIGSEEGNLPTAMYTVYNVHGEPIGHRLYSYQPVYEPEDDDLISREDSEEYETNDSTEELPNMTVLKGGLFPDHQLSDPTQKAGNINKLKHEYFERYVDKRRKRFLTQVKTEGADAPKEMNEDLEVSESKLHKNEAKSRVIRDINNEERDTEIHTWSPVTNILETHHQIDEEHLKVVPLSRPVNATKKTLLDKELPVLSIQYNNTNSTEVNNMLDKRDKRTSRKTDRLNHTTATIPKT